MMKKFYVVPETVIVQFQDGEELCNNLKGVSVYNESNGKLVDNGDTDSEDDPEFGIAGSKKFDAWSAWEE